MEGLGVQGFPRRKGIGAYRRPYLCGAILLAVALWQVVGASRASHGSDAWPQFRGPGGQGHTSATGLPLTWSPTENVTWRTAIPGLGWSSPVVSQGRVYLTTAVPLDPQDAGGDHSLRALALDVATGAILWEVEVFQQEGATAPAIHAKNSHASPTPIIEGDRLWVHFGHQGTACLSVEGSVLWSSRELAYAPVHGNGGSLSLVDGQLLFSCDGAERPLVAALAPGDGRLRWQAARPVEAEKAFSFSTPLRIEVAGRSQVVCPGSDVVSSYDPASGAEIWRVRYSGYSVIPRPVTAHGLVYVATGYNTPSVLAIRPDGRGDVTESHVAWTLTRGAPHTPSLLVVDDRLYMVADRGVATCVDALTGEVIWQERIGGNYSASPLYGDGRIYVQSEDGTTVVLRDSREFEVLATNSLGERTLASYAVTGRALLVRTEESLYRIEAAAN